MSKKVSKSEPVVDQLSQDDKEYHAKVMGNLQSAQIVANQWAAHLAEKYKITKEDALTMDGVVVRGANAQQELSGDVD